jgi:predicted DNA-binding antitoxin AbrB/MazE fold protein
LSDAFALDYSKIKRSLRAGVVAMAINAEAIYEGGLLRLAQPLPLDEHQRVRVTVHPEPTLAEQTGGLMGWRGSADDAEYFASSPELDFPPPAEET